MSPKRSKARHRESLPFSETEWSRVAEATLAVTNATLADDEVLSASHFVELQGVLTELRRVHGDHPVLLETEADFTVETAERIALYEAAKHAVIVRDLPTLSIRVALATELPEEHHDARRALDELMACHGELAHTEEDWARDSWPELLAKCQAALQVDASRAASKSC